MTATSHQPAQGSKPSVTQSHSWGAQQTKSTWGIQITGSMLIQFDPKVHFLTSTSPTSSVRWNQGQRDANAAKTSSCFSINIICDVRKGNNRYASQHLKNTNLLILSLQLEMMSPTIRGLAPERYLVFLDHTLLPSHGLLRDARVCVGVIINHSIYQRRQPQNSQWWRIIPHQSWLRQWTACPQRESISGQPECVCVCMCHTVMKDGESVGSRGHDRMDGWLVRKQCSNQQTQTSQRSRPFWHPPFTLCIVRFAYVSNFIMLWSCYIAGLFTVPFVEEDSQH